MENVKRNNIKKTGAVIAALPIILYFGAILATVIWASLVDGPPIGILIFFFVLLGLPIAGVVAALIMRLKEINGGEEDEASKY